MGKNGGKQYATYRMTLGFKQKRLERKHHPMSTHVSQDKLPITYFVLVVVLSIPFWLFGGSLLPLPMPLPFSSLMVVCPLLAAAILCYRQAGIKGVKQLLGKAFDFKKIKHWVWY